MLALQLARRSSRVAVLGLASLLAAAFSAAATAQESLTLEVRLPPAPVAGDPPVLERGGYAAMALRASAAGKLDGWVDFNRDRDFDDAGEQVFQTYPVHAGNNFASFRVPAPAEAGRTGARFRLSLTGGLSPAGPAPESDTEDLEAEIVSPSLASELEAWYARGQVWVTWRYDAATAPQLFEIYRAREPFESIEDAELAGKLFQVEYAGTHLAQAMRDAFGAAAPDHFSVPADSAGGRRRLEPDQGLFAGTVRESGEWHYAVVPSGQTRVPPQSITTAPVAEIFDESDPPACHEQARGAVEDVAVTFFNLWADGDQDKGAGRDDFPVFGNAAKRGAPHPFIIMEPLGGLPQGKAPACLAFHSGNAQASMWLPGDKDGFRTVGLSPRDGYVIALEDRLWSYLNGKPEHENTNWLGYVSSFDPFTDIIAYEGSYPAELTSAPGQFPPDDAVVETYTQDRLLWTLDWILARRDIDPDRVSLLGHSGGAKGALRFSRSRPERISSVVLFSPSLGDVGGQGSGPRMHGTPEQDLATTLVNRDGAPVRMNDTVFLTRSLSPLRDAPFTRLYLGKREENWAIDDDGNSLNDVLEEIRRADALGSGVAFHWDLREHGVDKWTFDSALERLGAALPAGWTEEDFWIPSIAEQTRRDDAAYLSRYRAAQSYPAFFRLEAYGGHGDPGTVIYDGTVPFDGVSAYDGTLTAEDRLPPFTGDDRGTWGGYFDWANDAEGDDALIDTPGLWACTMFLEGRRSPSGYPLGAVDEAPMAELSADVALRRPQEFLPPAGAEVEWRALDRRSGAELQRGTSIAGDDGLVVLTAIRVPKDPGIRVEARWPGPDLDALFRRGDANGDGRMDISDAARTLVVLFVDPAARLACEDAADSNDDGRIDIADASFSLNYLFSGGPAPAPPGPERCGADPSADELAECAADAGCGG
jgi:pimeloyl-ACP methyl ester carboxylesterase